MIGSYHRKVKKGECQNVGSREPYTVKRVKKIQEVEDQDTVTLIISNSLMTFEGTVSSGLWEWRASQVALVVKNLPANAGDTCNVRDTGLIPGSGRSPGGGHGNPLQYSCLENPMDRGAWRATVHGVAKSGA